MKIDRHDQAKILSKDEINRLFNVGLKKTRDRALFGVCLYTGTRIAETCALHTKDVYSIDGSVRPRVTIRRGTTKGKMSTRSVPVNSELRKLLEDYSSPKVYLFPDWRRGISYLKIGLRWLQGVLHKGRELLTPIPLLPKDPQPCFASKRAERDFYDQIWFSRIRSLTCHA